ncbi:MAG: TonB C-terminal domain-containing protein [Acidimicrobiia bacterium]|nr:TonB C-terminal domain-containing protein [Acidimicrobiia bacterium]
MTSHHDTLDEREPLRGSLLGSVGLHAAFAGVVALYGWQQGGERVRWGSPNAMGGGTVAISPVSQIPLPNRGGTRNPVANDTESRAPQAPKPERKSAREDDPSAIALKGREKKAAPKARPAAAQKYRAPGMDRPNQVYSTSGAAASTQMFGVRGSGGVGTGSGSPFGNRFGYYEQLLREKVARSWRTSDVDPRLQTAPPVIVTFEILRNGTIREVTVLQRSGNLALDYSCQRAILDAAPFQPLPAGFEHNTALIEFHFQLQR